MLLRFVNNDFIYSFLLSLFISGGRGERQVSICDHLRLRNKHTIGREGTNVDSCQREWMVLIEKTPGCVTDTHTHTLSPLIHWIALKGAAGLCVPGCVWCVSAYPTCTLCQIISQIFIFFFTGIILVPLSPPPRWLAGMAVWLSVIRPSAWPLWVWSTRSGLPDRRRKIILILSFLSLLPPVVPKRETVGKSWAAALHQRCWTCNHPIRAKNSGS